MKATAVTAFAIVGLMYIFQEHGIETKKSNAVIETYKIQKNILESNLTASIERGNILDDKNLELLSDFEKANIKYRAEVKEFHGLLVKKNEHIEEKSIEVETLLSQKSSLEENLTTQIEKSTLLEKKKSEIENRVAKLLTVDKIKELDSLLTKQENLEANLSAKIEEEHLLRENNQNLKTTIDNILQIAEDATKKATIEHAKDVEEYQRLLSNYNNLEVNLSAVVEKKNLLTKNNKKLEFNMSELLFISNESRGKLKDEHRAKIEELELTLAKEIEKEQILEVNLMAEIEKENLLKKKNSQLEAKLIEQIEVAKEDKKSALAESTSKIEELETTLIEEIEKERKLESNLTAEIEQEKLLREEKSALEIEIAEQISLSK